MQLPILRSLALVAVGNAALSGRDVSQLWPSDPIFQHSKSVDFMTPRQQGPLARSASGPVSWFAKLQKRGCRGLRLHNAPMRQSEKVGPIEERMLVGLVGGGPRWLIETVYPERSEFCEGFDRVGDQKAPDGKTWLSAYVLLGEAESEDQVDAEVAAATIDLRDALLAIEAVAREMPGAPSADVFVAGRAVLGGQEPPHPLGFLKFTQLTTEAARLLKAAGCSWVFGAMGSWNDLRVDAALKPRYESTSKRLFEALQRAVLVVANSTYRG